MTKKNITAVITLVSKTKELYTKHCKIVTSLIDQYEAEKLITKKLSYLVKDFLVKLEYKQFKEIKIALKSNIFEGSDICIQQNLFRKKKIIACDMDKTAIVNETIDLIGEKVLKSSHISELTNMAMNGSINFNKSIIERTKILKGISIKDIKKAINDIKLTRGVKTVIKTLNKNNCHTMLISGGYDLVADEIGSRIGFKEIISNMPVEKNGKLTGKLKGNIIDGKGKLNFLKKSMQRINAEKHHTLAVGDGQNDIEMINFSGLGISWRGFPKVNKAADAIASHSFKSVLYFQGYSDKDIVS